MNRNARRAVAIERQIRQLKTATAQALLSIGDLRFPGAAAWHWELTNAIRFATPVPAKGRQGLMTVAAELLPEVA